MSIFLMVLSCVICSAQEIQTDSSVVDLGSNQISLDPRKIIVAKETIQKIGKDYFRSDPFDRTFSEFITHLINDPTISNTEIHKRTDTSLFYFSGNYKDYNPFFFIPKKTQVVIAESEEKLIDSSPKIDTIITYQLAGYTTGDRSGEDDVTKEFEKFDRKYGKKFIDHTYRELKRGNTIYGAIINYFVVNAGIAPLTVAWQKIGSLNEHVFVITFRFKVRDNIASLPISSNQP